MKCPRCGHENDDDAKFCSNCGQRFLSEEEKERMNHARNFRNVQISSLTNRLLLFASIFALILIIVSIFLPSLEKPDNGVNIGLGGMAWFTSTGWDYLYAGKLPVGPFYITFILYIITILATFGLGVFALTSIFRSFYKKTPFKASSYIILIIIINMIYHAVFLAFYYEYHSFGNKYTATSIGWGLSILDYARVIFFIPFLIHLIASSLFGSDKDNRLIIILTVISSYFTLTNYSDYFTSSGIVNYYESQYYLYGPFQYIASLDYSMIANNGILASVIGIFISGLFSLLSSAFTFIYVARSVTKKKTVNVNTFLILASIQFASMVALLTCSMIFGQNINLLDDFYNYTCYFNMSLIFIIIYSSLMMIFAIVLFFKNRPTTAHTSYDA